MDCHAEGTRPVLDRPAAVGAAAGGPIHADGQDDADATEGVVEYGDEPQPGHPPLLGRSNGSQRRRRNSARNTASKIVPE
jgi:hypothetical protein